LLPSIPLVKKAEIYPETQETLLNSKPFSSHNVA
jgi:hypothetical protein